MVDMIRSSERNSILVAGDEEVGTPVQSVGEQLLVDWIVTHTDKWRRHRDNNFRDKWDEYYRLWRGIWEKKDSNRDSERSRIVAPALSQAIEMTVAEMEEASFSRDNWFDIADDSSDEDKTDMMIIRDMLLDDMNTDRVPDKVSETYLNGAIYGTGISKILVEEVQVPTLVQGQDGPEMRAKPTIRVRLEAIHPANFIIDSAARTVDEGMGCAHEIIKPVHDILMKQRQGFYRNVGLRGTHDAAKNTYSGETRSMDEDSVSILEYYGKVPATLLYAQEADATDLDKALFDPTDPNFDPEETELVEAIVHIANGGVLLRAVENPFLMKDRPIVAYQHDTVPNRFWGRGVAEKGYNPQKALDAEVRARIDAMGLAAHPMMGVDATRLNRGMDLKVKPGKIWLTMGPPKDTLAPFNFGDVNPASFTQSADFERMVQVGTGAMDSATPTNMNARNQTASGMSMMSSGFVKRAKRTMLNIERNYLSKLVEKMYWRYVQFDPQRYPPVDVKFQVKGSIGIMAREFEQSQLTQLLSVVPPESTAFGVLLRSIFDHSSSPNKAEMIKAVEQMMKPDPEQQKMAQVAQQLEMENKQLSNRKLESEIQENLAQAVAALTKADLEDEKVDIDQLNAFVAMKNSKNNEMAQVVKLAQALISKRAEKEKPDASRD